MNILVIDGTGCGLDWCVRSMLAGHKVKWFIRENTGPKKHGENLIERVKDFKPWMRWADLIFLTDNAQYMRDMQPYHDYGYPIFGCNTEAARFELQRFEGQAVLEKLGIDSIPSKLFRDYDDAIRYVKKRDGERLVCKPNGDADKALSYVAPKQYTTESLVYMLERWKKDPKCAAGCKKDGFIIQDFVGGIEMGSSGYFGKNGWAPYFTENWEFKKLMPGEQGPNTGEMGTVIRYVKNCKLADEMLKPLTPMLEKIGYRGDIDINAMIDENGKAWPLEFTCRPGWPAWIIETTLRKGDPAQWMRDLLDGKDTLEVDLENVATGFVVAQPDFPYDKRKGDEVEGCPVFGFDLTRHSPCDMMMDKQGNWQTSGTYICVTTGHGKTVSGSRLSAKTNYKALTIPNNTFIRDDVGERLQKQLPMLQKWGYAKGLVY